MWNKIQKIYIGSNQVRPPVPTYMEYSYNLVTAWSVAQMQSDWWTFERQSGVTPTSWWQFTTNWLHNTNTWSSNKFGGVKNLWVINCTNAKKITIQVEHYLVSGSWNGASTYRIYLTGVSGSAGWSINSMNNSWYNGYAWANPSTTTWNRVNLSTGNYTWTTIIDLENKTEVISLTWKTDINLTLSDSDVEKIRNYTDFQIYYDNVGNYYKSIYIKVEY